MNKDLVRFIREQRRQGITPQEIRGVLLKKGWQSKVVDRHMFFASLRVGWILASLILALGVTFAILLVSMPEPVVVPEPPTYEEDIMLLNRALAQRDMGLCVGISREDLRTNCEGAFTEKSCDETCQDIETLNMALAQNNATLCESISDAEVRNQCEAALAARGVE